MAYRITERESASGWRTITDVFDDHARRTPDALAVEAKGRHYSYAKLAARIDVLAARLAMRLGSGDRLVGVCLARDVDLPAWLFAVLKVGAAYLPIDPTTPPERLARVIEDARPTLVVASQCHADVVAALDVPVLFAEDACDAPPAPYFPVTPSTLAYVIFTSGSTGRPKGVEIEHGSLVALMSTMSVSPGLAAGERMMGLTRISFDLSVPDMFLPFFAGGALSLVDLDVAADAERLAAAFEEYRPHLAQATPSTWRALLESGWAGLPNLRIVAGGEAVTRALADRLLPRCGELWNIYGPTETTVWSTACRVLPGDGPIPIGWPMTGISVAVVNPDIVPVDTGIVGEIMIGGVGVARGYRNRPDLTAERFVTLVDGSRVYRTGDLGRFDAAGALFCLGRLDDQVKVRGFRIELGDVEAALALDPAIAWSAARLWTDASGEAVLVGYVVARAGAVADARAVKSALATRIAAYMIPDRIVTLPVMPLTANGKVDRAALPDPFSSSTAGVASDATILDRLGSIWCELLGLARVDAHDDFFDLGGYSLMTVRLTRRIESVFGVKLALVEMMQHATLAAMAARIERGDRPGSNAPMLLNGASGRPPLFWLDAGPLMRTMARGVAPDQPVFALNMATADEDALGDGALSIVAVAACLRSRLRVYQPRGPYYLGGWCRWGIVAFELAQQLLAEGETVMLLVLLDAALPHAARRGLRTQVRNWLRPSDDATPIESPSFSQRVEIATRSYVPAPYDGDVLLLRPLASRGDGGWKRTILGHLDIARVAGDHVTMVREPRVYALAARLDDALLNAQNRIAFAVADAPSPTSARTRKQHLSLVDGND